MSVEVVVSASMILRAGEDSQQHSATHRAAQYAAQHAPDGFLGVAAVQTAELLERAETGT